MSEIESFLEPISDADPTGPDLRNEIEDETFTRLEELTRTVDAATAESEADVVEADWDGVVSLCHSALHEKSKDLQLITALSAAWVRTEGLEAADRGIELLLESIRSFWPRLHPGFDPDDGEISLGIRLRWLNWMEANTGFIEALKQAPIVTAQGQEEPYSWTDHENCELLEDPNLTPERRQELVDTGVISKAQWQAALGTLGDAKLAEIHAALGRAMEHTRALREACEEPFAEDEDFDAPDFYRLLGALEEMHDYFGTMVGEAGGAAGELVAGEAAALASPGAARVSGGPVATRNDALRQLQEVGDFFRRTEPHSPVSYLIARAVKWGTMPLDSLLKDVVRNDDVLEHIWETLGLDASSGGGGAGEDEDEY